MLIIIHIQNRWRHPSCSFAGLPDSSGSSCLSVTVHSLHTVCQFESGCLAWTWGQGQECKEAVRLVVSTVGSLPLCVSQTVTDDVLTLSFFSSLLVWWPWPWSALQPWCMTSSSHLPVWPGRQGSQLLVLAPQLELWYWNFTLYGIRLVALTNYGGGNER